MILLVKLRKKGISDAILQKFYQKSKALRFFLISGSRKPFQGTLFSWLCFAVSNAANTVSWGAFLLPCLVHHHADIQVMAINADVSGFLCFRISAVAIVICAGVLRSVLSVVFHRFCNQVDARETVGICRVVFFQRMIVGVAE